MATYEQAETAYFKQQGHPPTQGIEKVLPPTHEANEALACAERLHNLIDGIEDRVFGASKLQGSDAVRDEPQNTLPIAEACRATRQRLDSAEQRLRSLLERL